MRRLEGFVRACHAPPTLAVSIVMTTFAWSLGWQDWSLTLVFLTVLVGQLSVGWSNDAFDAALDARAGRLRKPTVQNVVSARALWISASIALIGAVALSWLVAGPIGGSFHVFAIAMGWLYTIALARTSWSWLPYALAFGAMPLFLSLGLDGELPPVWTVAAFATVAVSGHLANALPDLESDRAAGLGGLAVRLGERRSVLLCWALLAGGTAVIALATSERSPLTAIVLVAVYLLALAIGARQSSHARRFQALLIIAVIDVVAIAVLPAL